MTTPTYSNYAIYHPIVTKLLISLAMLGLLTVVASTDDGKSALDSIRVVLRDHIVLTTGLLAILVLVSTLSPFFPEFLLSVAAGFIFGLAFGSAFAIVSVSLGALMNFTIARHDGRRALEYTVDVHSVREIGVASSVAPSIVFLTWLLPSINHDLISFIAGLSRMRYPTFLAFAIAGTTVWSVVLSFLGDKLHSGDGTSAATALMIYTLFAAVIFAADLPRRLARPGESSTDH